MQDHSPVHLILMGNTMEVENSKYIENIFDLKGSITKREVFGIPKNTTVLKDVNLKQLRKNKIVNISI